MPDLNYGTGIAARQFPRRMAILSQQIDQCRSLLRSLAGDNPFYTRKFEEAGTSYAIRNLVELAESVPLIRRQDLLEDRRANPPWGTNLTLPLARYRLMHLPGEPAEDGLCQLDTVESWESFLANGAEVFRSGGVTASDRIFFASSFEHHPGCRLPFQSGTQLNGLCMSGAGLEERAQWEAILGFEATVLCGCAGSLLRLVDHAAAFDPARSRVRLILGDGRPDGAASIRKRLLPLLPEARFYDHYALPETGAVACECPARPDLMHVLEPSFIPEVIDPATSRVVEAGVAGELVLTTLFRPGSPLVRYRTGDRVRVSPDTACECGRYYTALEGGVLGRLCGR